MISAYMGPHYGNDVSLPGAGKYQMSLLVSPPVSARHIEYEHVWLHPHRVNVTFHWTATLMTRDTSRAAAGRLLTRRRFLLGTRRGGRRRGSVASGWTGR